MTKKEFIYYSLTTFAVAGLAISLYSHYSTNMSFTENSFDTQTGKLTVRTRFDTGNLGNLAHANDRSIRAEACAYEFENQIQNKNLLVQTSGRPIIPPGEYIIPKSCGGGLPIVKPEMTATKQEIPFDWSEPLKYIFVAGGFAGLSALILKGAKMLSAHERRTVISSFIPDPIKLTADAPHTPDPRMKSDPYVLELIRRWTDDTSEKISDYLLGKLDPPDIRIPVIEPGMSPLRVSQAREKAIRSSKMLADKMEEEIKKVDDESSAAHVFNY